ncbi:MAG: hypothetical protein Q8P51_16880 [Ignavibacteria bacterium]|jgi:hypothetical protein|nr:hypothetical protein [Ignavibacteria bacterium]
MLQEINNPESVEGNLIRKWFTDEFFDLFVWSDNKGEIASFQLCYDKGRDEHALTWKRPSSYYHQRVDDGENRPGKSKSTPVLMADGMFDFRKISARFKTESADIDQVISGFVSDKLLAFGRQTLA